MSASKTSPFLVGFSGYPGSAKNHFSFKLMQELRFQGYRVHKGSLAAPLYEEVNELVDSVQAAQSIEHLNIPKEWMDQVLTLASGDVGEKHSEYGYSRRNENIRKLLSLLGGVIREEQDPLYLMKKMVTSTPEGKDFLLFTDLRLPAQADYTVEHGVAVRCEVNEHWVAATTEGAADGYKYSEAAKADITETGLDEYDRWFIKLMYNRNRPILFAHSLMRAYGFLVRRNESFTVYPQ